MVLNARDTDCIGPRWPRDIPERAGAEGRVLKMVGFLGHLIILLRQLDAGR